MNEKKDLLRREMKRIRAKSPASDRREEELLARFIAGGFAAFHSYFVYNSFGSEAGTKKLISYLLKKGKDIYLPKTEEESMYPVKYSGRFSIGVYGIEEPVGEKYRGNIDVCVLPLLAVDKEGNRLGYGGGYYDKFLRDNSCLRIAYCYDFQVIEKVESEPFDVKVQYIVTDKRTIKI